MNRKLLALLLFISTAACAQAPNRIIMANAGSTGTTLNTLTKVTGAPSTAVIVAASDAGGVVGITIAGAGTTGNAVVQINSEAPCVFDGGTTAGDYVQKSSTTNGDCHDAGGTYPMTGQLIGRVLSTHASGGTYTILLFPSEIQTQGGGGGSPPCIPFNALPPATGCPFRYSTWTWTGTATNNPPTSDQYAAFGGTGANAGCATNTIPPCITQGNAQGYVSALNWIVGQNIVLEEFGQLTTLSSTCVTIDVNGSNDILQSCTTLGSLQDNASFLFGGTLETTNWGCVTANGTNRQITTSSIAADTNAHVFTIQFNDAVPNVVFSIDGVVACTVTTDLPPSGTVMEHSFFVGGTTGGLYREFAYYIQSGNSW